MLTRPDIRPRRRRPLLYVASVGVAAFLGAVGFAAAFMRLVGG